MNNNEDSTFVFRQLFDKDTGTFTYLMFDSATMEGLIIDPVKEQFERSLQFIEELGVELKYVIDTHVHADQVTSSCMLRDATGAKSAFGETSAVWNLAALNSRQFQHPDIPMHALVSIQKAGFLPETLC